MTGRAEQVADVESWQLYMWLGDGEPHGDSAAVVVPEWPNVAKGMPPS